MAKRKRKVEAKPDLSRKMTPNGSTRSIQLWPKGTCLWFGWVGDNEYDKDNWRIKDQSFGRDNPARKTRWRKPDAATTRLIEVNQMALRYQDHEILCCDSLLVDELLKKGGSGEGGLDGWEYDIIENVYVDPSMWTALTCKEYLDDEGVDYEDINFDALDPDATEDELRERVREHSQENPREVYEWWRVSSWLCARLRDIGECVIDNDYGCWWGRCTTGQAYIMDGVLQRVAESTLPKE